MTLDEAAAAMKLVAERVHVVIEGAAACAVAAALSGRIGTGKIVAIVSGGNIDLTRFATLVGACPATVTAALATAPWIRYLQRRPVRPPASPQSLVPESRLMERFATPVSRPYPPSRRTRHRRLVELAARRPGAVPPARSGRRGAPPRTTRRGCCARSAPRRCSAPPTTRSSCALYDARHRRPRRRPPAGQLRGGASSRAAADGQVIAYFSAEFALHQSLPIYAGGLGVLAGDHCKEASDLGVPLVGVGFMYPQGYFHQRVTNDGWQQEHYERINWADAPIETAITPDGKPCITAVPLGDRTVLAAVWRVRVGHVRLYLLDTDLEENAPWDRELSARLYGGDRETRIQQEVILGIGGVRVLRALGIEPAVWHLNEGHAAFVVLQRIREHIEQGQSFDEALALVRATTVFTTHTPVPAGHDAFPFHLVEKHLAGCWGELGQHRARFLALGEYDNGHGSQFNMTALALRTAEGINAVSELHGHVTREMWQPMWPDRPVDGVPVQAITNGVHVPTWVAGDLRDAARRASRRRLDLAASTTRRCGPRFDAIPDADLWRVRLTLRDVALRLDPRAGPPALDRGARRAGARAWPHGTLLDPNALTIGFARRFAAYKRPELHLPRRRAAGRAAQRRRPPGADRLRRQGPSRPTTRPSTTCSGSSAAPSIRSSAAASPSSTTTTCTSRTCWCRAATCG